MSKWTRPKLADRHPSHCPPEVPPRVQIRPKTRKAVRGVGHSRSTSRRSLSLGKQLSKKRRRNARSFGAEIIEFEGPKFRAERAPPPIKALTPTQGDYLDALRTSPQVVVIGPAGTGKTWIAATHAADLYRNRVISKIILTRPNVPCGRSLGYFPGSMEDK